MKQLQRAGFTHTGRVRYHLGFMNKNLGVVAGTQAVDEQLGDLSLGTGSRATRLSILISLYNEEEFIAALLNRVIEAPLPQDMDREIIIVDDGSNDGSSEIAAEFAERHPASIRFIRHSRNQGKKNQRLITGSPC